MTPAPIAQKQQQVQRGVDEIVQRYRLSSEGEVAVVATKQRDEDMRWLLAEITWAWGAMERLNDAAMRARHEADELKKQQTKVEVVTAQQMRMIEQQARTRSR